MELSQEEAAWDPHGKGCAPFSLPLGEDPFLGAVPSEMVHVTLERG